MDNTCICNEDSLFSYEHTSLGDDKGILFIRKRYFFNKTEDELSPGIGFKLIYKGNEVYSSMQRINYCPFCGRKLRES